MGKKSVIIIGAGIAGLSAGCYAGMNGYHARVFEAHSLPGGLCTSWNKGGYTIDGCIHWLVGTKPHTDMNAMYLELGALQGNKVVNHEEFLRIVHPSGKTLILYADADRLEKHMLELDPLDEPVIKEFCSAIRDFSKMDIANMKPKELMDFSDMLHLAPMLPYMGKMKKYGSQTAKEFVEKFKDPVMKDMITNIVPIPEFPILLVIMMMSFQHAQNAGYPLGGSLEFSKAI